MRQIITNVEQHSNYYQFNAGKNNFRIYQVNIYSKNLVFEVYELKNKKFTYINDICIKYRDKFEPKNRIENYENSFINNENIYWICLMVYNEYMRIKLEGELDKIP